MSKELKLYNALKRIASYETPERLRRSSDKDYGLDYEEALEMAYENVLYEARMATMNMHKPKE